MKKPLGTSARTRIPLSILATLASTSAVIGADVTWSGSSNSSWGIGTNWVGNNAPVAADIAVFSNASPANQPTVTANTSVTGLTLTVNPTITINSGIVLTVTGATNTTGSGGLILAGPGNLSFTATGNNLSFGSGSITLDGGGFQVAGSEVAINTTTGMPTGNLSLNNNFVVTSSGGRLVVPNSGANASATVLNGVTLGGTLTMTSGTGGQAEGYVISGNLTLQQDSARTLRITQNTGHNGSDWIAGKITDGVGSAGNALRFSILGRSLQIANGTNDYIGGTVVEGGGGNVFSYLDVLSAGTLGTGNLAVESGGRIRLNNPTVNLGPSATVRAAAGSAVGVGGNVNISERFTSDSAGIYGIEGSRSYAIDQSAIGNGRMFLGTVTGGNYSGTLSPGSGATYRLGGGGGSFGSFTATTTSSILTISGIDSLTGSNSLIVGSGLNNNASGGRVLMSANQSFAGNITVNIDGMLATSINGGTPFGDTTNNITVYGIIAATGANGVFNNAIYDKLNLRPGASILLNNNNIFANTAGGNNNDRWLDTQGLTLNGTSFTIQGPRSSDTSETIGSVSFDGNARLQLQRNSTSGQDVILTIGSLTRESRGTMTLASTGNLTLGSDTDNASSRIVISGTAPTLLNGSRMVAPHTIQIDNDGSGNATFVTYNSTGGVNVTGTRGFTAATWTGTDLNLAGATDLVNSGAVTLTGNRTVYALRVSGALSRNGIANSVVTIGSGSDPAGLIDQMNGGTHTATLDFGGREAIIWKTSGNPTVFGNTTAGGGIVTTGGLTKAGAGNIVLGGNATSISGGININQGQISINSTIAADSVANNLVTINHEGTLNLNNFDLTVAGLAGSGRNGQVTNSGANARTITINLGSGNRTYDGRLQASGTASSLALTKSGAGTQIFSSESVASYTGATSVTGGSLVINGDFSAATGNVTVSGGILGGSGTIGGNTTIQSGGTVGPGNSPGILTFTNGLTVDGTYAWELAALSTSGAGTNFDQISLTGGNGVFNSTTFSMSFGTNLAPDLSSDSFWNTNQSWIIVNNTGTGSVSGTFAAINNAAWIGKGAFSISLGSGSGGDVTLNWTAATQVPEPSAFAALAGLGALGFAASRRRRR